MSDDNDPAIEYSNLCSYAMQSGVTVRVVICRPRGDDGPWTLKVVDDRGISTAWDKTFPTEQDAFLEFFKALDRDGIGSFAPSEIGFQETTGGGTALPGSPRRNAGRNPAGFGRGEPGTRGRPCAGRGAKDPSVTDDDNPEIEYSTLCGYVTEEGITVRVVICRLKGADEEGWALEVIDAQGTSTAWDETFPTEREAYREFYDTLNREGIRSFLT